MADGTKIEWCDATWNPIVGCSVVSPGCTHCYAMRLAGTRLRHHPSRAGLTIDTKAGPVWNGEVRLMEQWLDQPLRWKQPRRIFVCAHGDLFHESVPDAWIDRVFGVMALAPRHTFQVLTKRSKRMRSYLSAARAHPVGLAALEQTLRSFTTAPHLGIGRGCILQGDIAHLKVWPLPNVWLGVSVEGQRHADERIPDLLATPAAVRFISAEPLLGAIDLRALYATEALTDALAGMSEHGVVDAGDRLVAINPTYRNHPRLDWVIAGGESGPNARPMHPEWARSLRDQCTAAGVPFFFKQWGEWTPHLDRDTEDPDWRQNYTAFDADPKFQFLNAAGGCGFHGDRLYVMHRAGKKAAGALLDGREWREMPDVMGGGARG